MIGSATIARVCASLVATSLRLILLSSGNRLLTKKPGTMLFMKRGRMSCREHDVVTRGRRKRNLAIRKVLKSANNAAPHPKGVPLALHAHQG